MVKISRYLSDYKDLRRNQMKNKSKEKDISNSPYKRCYVATVKIRKKVYFLRKVLLLDPSMSFPVLLL